MPVSIPTGVPTFGTLVRAYRSYILFDYEADAAHSLRIKYLADNSGRSSDGATTVDTVTSSSELPDLPKESHELLVKLVTLRLVEDLAFNVDQDGKSRYPGIAASLEYLKADYENELKRVKTNINSYRFDMQESAYRFSGDELYPSYYR